MVQTPPNMSQTVYTHIVMNQEGELQEAKYIKKEVRSTSEFIQLYFEHVSTLAKLPRIEYSTLMCIIKHISWKDNDFQMGSKTMQEIVECSGLKVGSIHNALSRLTKRNILQRVKHGWYKLNPKIFWKGSELDRQKQFTLVYEWNIVEDNTSTEPITPSLN